MICSGRGTHDSSPFFTLPRSSPHPLLNGELFFAVMTLIVRPFSFLPVPELRLMVALLSLTFLSAHACCVGSRRSGRSVPVPDACFAP